MPAVVRGGPRKPTRPRAEAPASPQRPAGRAQRGGRRRPRNCTPRKGVGVSPKLALTVAGGALVSALVATLATGHRAERLGSP
jgi:cell division protein FtsQ